MKTRPENAFRRAISDAVREGLIRKPGRKVYPVSVEGVSA